MIPKSSEIRIEVTTKCNYNCIICPRKKLTRKKETMSYETFKFLFDKINSETIQYNTLTFPGMGEPLLDESIDQKIMHAKKAGFSILMLTNGSLLTVERFKKLQDLGVDSVRVSIYGNSIESYNAVHGIKNKGMFEKVRNNLTKIAAIKNHTKLLLTYNIVDNMNESSFKTWITYWKEKADLIEVWRPHNWVNTMKYRVIKPEKIKTCGRPWTTPLQVQVDGTVNMCCFDFDGRLLLGDLKQLTLHDVFESKMFRKILDHHNTGNFEQSGLICAECDQRNLDKSDIMVFNSKFDIKERINKVSTTYSNLI